MKDLKKKNDSELQKVLEEKREKLRTLRFNMAGATTKNVKERAGLRKEVARILTELQVRSSQA